MFCRRITKYDSKYRNKNGFYTKEEWTSYSDIGKVFGNEKCTYEKYSKIEDAYINSIQLFMDCLRLESLQITNLENFKRSELSRLCDSTMVAMIDSVQNLRHLNKTDLVVLSRLVLRENLWCKLQAKNMFVHFGYDYYMYIGSNEPCQYAISKIQELGLFVEVYHSPYLE